MRTAALTRFSMNVAERGLLPDALVRAGIRSLCRKRLQREMERVGDADPVSLIAPDLEQSRIAQDTERANQQHYEVPTGFFQQVLGPRLKYSSGYFGKGIDDLASAEEAALELTARHADLADGQQILELGCGWGSLTLWMAENLPRARITAVSNSATQRAFIEGRLRERGREDVEIITTDMNGFDPRTSFDRIVSVEMFEHMRNWSELLARVSSWLHTGGRFFAHVFCHKSIPYLFDENGADDWMARHFFTGGLMPSADLMPRLAHEFQHEDTWIWDGRHYERTANAWLERLDARRPEVEELLAAADPKKPPQLAVERWRIFFMACAELFGFDQGRQWQVIHYLFTR